MEISFNGRVYFTPKDLTCQCGCGTATYAKGFPEALLALRLAFNRPMNLNSACRCPAHNQKSGGAKQSYHLSNNPVSLGACAIDVRRVGAEYDTDLVKLALALNWSVGFHKAFIHLDRRVDFGQTQLTFLY